MKIACHAIAQQGFHGPRLVRDTCRHSGTIQFLTGMRLRESNYLRLGAHRVRLFRRFDTWPAGRHPLTAGADGALLRWSVSHASGGYSKHARCVYVIHAIEGHHRGKGKIEIEECEMEIPTGPIDIRVFTCRRT